MRRWIWAVAVAAAFLLGLRLGAGDEAARCRIWVDGVLVYDGAGTALEDVALMLDPEQTERIRVECDSDRRLPAVVLELTGEEE